MTVPTETEKKNPNEEKDLNAFICSQNGILKGELHSLFIIELPIADLSWAVIFYLVIK